MLVASSASAGGLERVRKDGVLQWGGDLQGGEPYVYRDAEGKLVGFEVDLTDAIARELGVRAEFVQNDWSNLVPSLERGTFDVALNGLEVTDALRGRVIFTRPYYLFAERLVARKGDTRVKPDLAKLDGLRVGTLANSLAHQLLRGTHANIVIYEGTEEPYIDLINDRSDAVLLDDIIVGRYASLHPELAIVGDVAEGTYAGAVRSDEADLAAAIDGALAKITERGELEAILRRAGLWTERQRALATAAVTAQPPPEVVHFSRAHVLLFLRGAGVTLVISTLAMALAIGLGLLLALARHSGPRWSGRLASAYIELYRGTPVLIQLYVLYYGLAPIVRIGPFAAAIVGLGMNYAAYEAEVYRAGILAVPKGQMDAALSLGMSTPLALRRVILPQALRIALPSMTNDFISLLKDTSLVSIITVVELTKQMTITAVDVRGWLLPGALCAALYFAMSYPLGALAARFEKKLARQ
jgi:polar amino acid transport system substrate-binding protein